MSTEANKAIIHTMAEQFNARNPAAFEALFSPDFRLYTATTPNWPRGIAGARSMFTAMQAAAPDMRIIVDDLIAEGDRVAVRWTFQGTVAEAHASPERPAGTTVTNVSIAIYRIVDGKIVEDWGVVEAWPGTDVWQ